MATDVESNLVKDVRLELNAAKSLYTFVSHHKNGSQPVINLSRMWQT
jgi:hypothetical protein